VAAAGEYAYVVDGNWEGLHIIDVADPAAPFEVGFCSTPGEARGVAVAGTYAYVADYSAGLRVIDISDPAAPTKAGYYETPGTAIGVAVAGDYIYVADMGDGLLILRFELHHIYLPLVLQSHP
jgi:hypothetical protein